MKLNNRRITCIFLLISVLITMFPSAVFTADEKMPDFYMFEGEDGIFGKEGGGDLLKLAEDEEASGGVAVTGKKTHTDPNNLGYIPLKFEFEATEDANFTFWYRTKVYSGGSDTAYFSIDNEPFDDIWIAQQSGVYDWFVWETKAIKKGKHTFNFSIRESAFTLDKVVITADQTYVPLGKGQEPKPFEFGENKDETWTLTTKYLPAYTPTYGHPRVMINKDDLPRIRKNLECEEHKEVYKTVLSMADRPEGGQFTGDPATAYTYNYAASYIEANAFLYLIHGDKERGRKAIDGLFEYQKTHNAKVTPFQYRSAGYEVFLSAEVYDWCYPLLTEKEKKDIISRAILCATQMEVGWPPIKQSGANDGHDSEYQIMRDLFSFAIAVWEDYPEFYNNVAGKIFSEYVPKRNFYYEDSMYHSQGDAYGQYRYCAELYMTYLLEAMGVKNLIHKNQHLMAYPFIYRKRADGAHMGDSDNYDVPLNGYSATEPLFFAGNFYNDPYLRMEFYKCNWRSTRNNSDQLSPIHFLCLNKPEIGLKPFTDLPLSMYGGDKHGVMTARTSWDEGVHSNSMLVSMKIIEFITRSHTHFDSGNFEIYYKGGLAIDSGIYNGEAGFEEDGTPIEKSASGTIHDINYNHRTVAHNAMLIYDPSEVPIMGTANDGGQRTLKWLNNTSGYHDVVDDPDYDYGEVLARDFGPDMNKPDYTYLEGDLTKAYTSKVSDYSRAFMFFNFFDEVYPGALVVFDRVKSSDATFKKSWLLHSQEEPTVEDNKITIKRTQYEYDGRLINETLLPKAENRELTKIGGPGKQFWVDGKNYSALNSTKGYEYGNWRVELSPKNASEHDYFLNVLQVSENDDEIVPLESKYLETEHLIGAQIRDRVAYFGKTKERSFKTLTVKGEACEYEKLKYVVAGVSEGVWQVKDKNGKLLEEITVPENTGVVSFEAPAGEYILKPTPSRKTYTKDFNILKYTEETKRETLFKYNGYFKTLENSIVKEGETFWMPVENMLSLTRNTSSVNGDTYTIETGNGKTDYSISRDMKNINGINYIPLDKLAKSLEMKYSYNKIPDVLTAESTLGGALIIFNSGEEGIAEIRDVKWTHALSNGNGYQSVDGENSTAWISAGKQSITYELTRKETVYGIDVKWAASHTRVQYFDIEVSEDGVNFEKVYEGGSDGVSTGFEKTEFEPKEAKFVRIYCRENSLNDKNNLQEIKILVK